MESFIRSKYESRRWAMDGPPPADPSALDDGSPAPVPVQQEVPAVHHQSRASDVPSRSAASSALNTRQPAPHRLLSAAVADRSKVHTPVDPVKGPQTAPPPPQPKAPENDLFSLDFHAPPVSSSANNTQPKKDVKTDILSLFSAPAAQAQPPPAFGNFGGVPQQQSPWDQFGGGSQVQQPSHQAPPTSMMGSNGIGAWGASSGWNAPVVPPAQGNVWGNPTPAPVPVQQPAIWGSAMPATTAVGNSGEAFGAFTSSPSAQKKDDVFGDLWGGFK
jgi:stromal membrane-associated protein